ncbi:hypothetical protein PSACC_01533 [Paramicrosporidium saccamoebae]|uniref:Tubulin-specific chaperone A n=1 Tax=Paramicrosporidium saccamoebae TaxID=1246581 RepID=A0A2H9TLK3_9FUNG|nr:hypothetical protein PSACC_01533 [Paramicrosporidium saccamoebae]
MPSAVGVDLNKKLTVKVNVVKRYAKEIAYYRKEHSEQDAKITGLRAQECCPHDLANQVAVGKETEAVLNECQTRYKEACDDLRDFLVQGRKVL